MSTSDAISGVVDSVKESWAAAKSEAARRNVQLSYWGEWFDGLKYSRRQFYATVARKLEECQVPDLEPEIVLMKQGGIFSAERLYLRFRRERLVFEICAAPFGRGFFVSERLFDRRREARLLHLLLFFGFAAIVVISLSLALFFSLAAKFGLQAGLLWALVVFSGLVIFVVSVFRFGGKGLAKWVGQTFPEIPFVGPVYEFFFQPNTYFRQDTNACYRTVVHQMVMEAIDEMTKANGIRQLTEEQRRPRLGPG